MRAETETVWKSRLPRSLDHYTQSEASSLIEDAIRLHVEDRLDRGEPIYEEVGVSQVKVAV